MTRASDTQDQTEDRGPGTRGWFQPLGPTAAGTDGSGEAETAARPQADANGHGAQADLDRAPDQFPDETTVFPRIPAGDVADDELPTADQAPLVAGRPAG